MVIQTNIAALQTLGQYQRTNGAVSKTLEKLSSGFRINRAADDAAGLGVSQSMRAQIAELARCQRNVQEGIDVTNTADGALAEINSMLIRARELCIEGANGIYSQTELDAISDELNELFDAIDQITAGTRHNDIQLFRFDGQSVNGTKIKYDYIDHFTPQEPVDPSDPSLKEWGEISWISREEFGDPPEGTPATVTLTFDKDVDINNAASLDGKSLTVNGFSYTFRKSGGGISYGSIPVYEKESVQKAMNRFVQRAYGTVAEAEVHGNQVTFKAELDTLTVPTNVNGIQINFEAENANAEWAHKVAVGSYETGGIPELYKTGIAQGDTTYSTTVSNKPQPLINPAADAPIGETNAENLNKNKLEVYIDPYHPITIDFETLFPPFNEDSTWGEIADKIAQILNKQNLTGTKDPIQVTYTPEKGFSITVTGLDEKKSTPVTIKEITAPSEGGDPTIQEPVPGGKKQELKFDKQFEIGITEISEFNSTYETLQCYEIKIPDDIPYEPFAVCVNGKEYYFFDSSRDIFPDEKFPDKGENFIFKYENNLSGDLIDLKGLSPDKIKDLIYDKVQTGLKNDNEFRNNTGFYTMEEGSSFLVVNEGKKNPINIYNSPLPADSILTAVETYPPKTNDNYVEPSKGVLSNIKGLLGELKQTVEESQITLDLGNKDAPFNPQNFIGKGGMIAGKRFEFVDKADSGLRENYEDLDISQFTSFEDVKDYFTSELPDYNVELQEFSPSADSPERHIRLVVSKTGGAIKWSDGNSGYPPTDGLFSNGVGDTVREYFAGGKNSNGYSSTVLDFSGIDNDNKEEKLMGKGFRITCASCHGEYINIFFCWKKDEQEKLESFDIIDKDTGQTRTIHNIAVELSKFSDGEGIVQNIVNQLTPELNHFTAVEVGDPPSQLIARDTRVGDIRNNKGEIVRAEVLTGVRTNFDYDYDKVKPGTKPSGPSGPSAGGTEGELGADFREMLIYAGSEPDHQWIPIHLPYLDLPTMKLRPPTMVDLGGGDDPFDWLDRVDAANGLIITSRTRIGADYNRLEHTYGALTQTRENIEASESRIRDADMAKLMVQYMKDEIIGQAQQSMMIHSNGRPQQILELLR